jgi:transglutaminase-like putative cysteine protease
VIRAPAGRLTVSADFLVQDNGARDEVAPEAAQHSLETLPVESLVYLLGSRYCETDRFTEIAWSRFGNVPKGWPLVQAICDYGHIAYRSVTSTRVRPRQPGMPIPSSAVCAVISPILRSRCAAA